MEREKAARAVAEVLEGTRYVQNRRQRRANAALRRRALRRWRRARARAAGRGGRSKACA